MVDDVCLGCVHCVWCYLPGVCSLWLVMPCVCPKCVHCVCCCLVSVWSVFTVVGDALCLSVVCSLWLVMPCVCL